MNRIKIYQEDIIASISVFLVAIPLCLGIAHASGAPLLSGLIAGIVGGIIVGFVSKSNLSVTGPAAGLTAIVIAALQTLGSFEALMIATAIAGIVQIALGALRAGGIASYLPFRLLQGLLAAIGVIIILKQFPHLIGFDVEQMGVEEFLDTPQDLIALATPEGFNTITNFIRSFFNLEWGVTIVGVSSLVMLFAWDKFFAKKYKIFPISLAVVLLGVALNAIFARVAPNLYIEQSHLVTLPANPFAEIRLPNFSHLANFAVYGVALQIALVASLESLLSVEAIDKLDPEKRKTPANRELVAQGIGNFCSGLLGGLPVTSVIVRSSVNVNANAKTKTSTILHGILLLLSVATVPFLLNMIPLACLAAVLIHSGYKLAKPSLFVENYRLGWSQFLPFVVTLVAIVFTDLLEGVLIGLAVSIFFILRKEYLAPVVKFEDSGLLKKLRLEGDLNYLHKPQILDILENKLAAGSIVEIDGTNAHYIDQDIFDALRDFSRSAKDKGIKVLFGGLPKLGDNELYMNEVNDLYEKVLARNAEWVQEVTAKNPEFFEELAKGQAPEIVFIGCSDSRAGVETITKSKPGTIFVHRNIANSVVLTDMNLMSVLQYSVEVLRVKYIVVCGHYECGGCKAALTDQSFGIIDLWLSHIKDTYHLHRDELENIVDAKQKEKRLIELHVIEQLLNLEKSPIVQKASAEYGFPILKGWIFDLHTGKIVDITDEFQRAKHDSIYNYRHRQLLARENKNEAVGHSAAASNIKQNLK